MTAPDLVLYEEEFQKIKEALNRLRLDANANVVFLVDKNGQQIAAVGDLQELDTTSLASLTAGTWPPRTGRPLIGKRSSRSSSIRGRRTTSTLDRAQRVILVVIFDERSSLGLVRLRGGGDRGTRERSSRRSPKSREEKESSWGRVPFAEITDGTSTGSSPSDPRPKTFPTSKTPYFHHYAAREITLQDRLLRPGLCGKRPTSIHLRPDHPSAKGKLISLATETDRTLFFDFLPLDLGRSRDSDRFHLYTVPGQVFYDASRKLIRMVGRRVLRRGLSGAPRKPTSSRFATSTRI